MPDNDGEIRLPAPQLGDVLDLTAVLLSVWLIALVFFGWHGPLGVLLTLAFAFFCPRTSHRQQLAANGAMV